ncbi:TetR family transcriptional regulator [Methylobacterium brachythecii]|uniref:AcrR family transcriptional regulator n=1 Tax=Methylobacterium brachythecii TaxID=1176177 RepID=A0A7W6AJ38_9HYPH|nr:TetR family transcriptional regulator [Methylobacterium brachythecii]MBB3903401.1 AcrR family transcriptional regulator [Methylobacterium brachythecii]GLS45481.1 TetR family transcriptional regulator [Methylobacterium brachythecii]
MTATKEEAAEPREGLRERKRRQTRARIAEAGMRLFLERGFEETTLDAIAEQADIARRTFFHYFDTKEAILNTLQDTTESSLRAVIVEADPKSAPFDVVCEAMLGMISRFGTEEARAIDRLLRSTETLRARKQANYQTQEQMIFEALRQKWPEPDLALKLRLVSLACVGALRLASDAWSASDGTRPLQDHLVDVFSALRADITRGSPMALD